MTLPCRSRTGAETLATPASRSAALCAQPRLRTSARARSVNVAPGSTAACVPGSLWASNTLAPDPADIGRREPTGTVSRSPAGGSRAATHMRTVPSRRYSCTLAGDFAQLGSTWALALRSGSLTCAASSVSPAPSCHCPSPSRDKSRCTSSPAASRCAVARGDPCVRTIPRARRASRLWRSGPAPLCRGRRCRYAVSRNDTNVPNIETQSARSQ